MAIDEKALKAKPWTEKNSQKNRSTALTARQTVRLDHRVMQSVMETVPTTNQTIELIEKLNRRPSVRDRLFEGRWVASYARD